MDDERSGWGPENLYPVLRAENAEVVIHPDDRKYGALLVGGQGTGRPARCSPSTSTPQRTGNAAPIVMDPKSELSPHLPERDPARLRQTRLVPGPRPSGVRDEPVDAAGDRPLAIEAAQIAENVVAALLDINENQIFASSRRYLYHAVIGAIALAESDQRRPTLEDMLHACSSPAKHRLAKPGRRRLRRHPRSRFRRPLLERRAPRRAAPRRLADDGADGRAAQQDLRR